jgi:hypothetical protein
VDANIAQLVLDHLQIEEGAKSCQDAVIDNIEMVTEFALLATHIMSFQGTGQDVKR